MPNEPSDPNQIPPTGPNQDSYGGWQSPPPASPPTDPTPPVFVPPTAPTPPVFVPPTGGRAWSAGPPWSPPAEPYSPAAAGGSGGHGGFGPGPGVAAGPDQPGTARHARRTEPRRGRTGLAALAIVATFAAGVGGVVVGRETVVNGGAASSSAAAVPGEPVATVPGPVSSDTVEPAAAVAKALSPAVVQIETTKGLGSGFIYDKSGLILTAAHVPDGASDVTVRLADGTSQTGKVIGSDASTDVAVVKIEGRSDLPVAALATGVQLQVGQTAIAIGSPFGLDQTVTEGIVSALGRSTQTPGGVIPAIQTDAPINSGNSGGALADRQGRIIGINDSIITGNSQASGNVGVGFAIPIDIAKAVADKLVAGESTDPGFLGVGGTDAKGDRAGATISSVEPGSPAATAGLATGDVIVSIDGREVNSMIDLAAAIRTKAPGASVSLTALRDGKERQVTVTLTKAPADLTVDRPAGN